MDSEADSKYAQQDNSSSSLCLRTAKAPVVRGARACTVCRAAKMKCVGAEDGQKQCQRCKRAGVECIFEKHRRGRKPGSKLSEASKMLRRLEKGHNQPKIKSQPPDEHDARHSDDLRIPPVHSLDSYSSNSRSSEQPYSATTSHFPSNELPPMKPYHSPKQYPLSSSSRPIPIDEEDDDQEQNSDEPFAPMKLIHENKRNSSFFRTILNPAAEEAEPPRRSTSFTPPYDEKPIRTGPLDPLESGLLDDATIHDLFDKVLKRLNPFVNLFDPSLHTADYVRAKCPFLFTTLLMAGCKFFRPDKFKQIQKLAHEFSVLAFAEGWKRVEVVQAFACLTYWKDPTDTKTWTYIGYACRMAVELGLNRFVPNPPATETPLQRMERRNRERTYLVLFVHDRSLSMQTGRHWMLPEDDLVRNSIAWHETSGNAIRPEDVVIAAFVSLRRIAAETTEIFNSTKGTLGLPNSDINYEHVLQSCNQKLTAWDRTWRHQMENIGGDKFHFAFLTFFRLHVRLFLNSFGLHAALMPNSREPPSLGALMVCCHSAIDSLRIVHEDFYQMQVLRYGQDSITVMSAYSAVFLLKLLRTPNTGDQLGAERANDIYNAISQTADAYDKASMSTHSSVSFSAAYHARFLRSLVENDIFKTRRVEQERGDTNMPIDPRLQAPSVAPSPHGGSALQNSPSNQVYTHQVHAMQEAPQQNFLFPPHQNEYQDGVQPIIASNGSPNHHVQYPGTFIPTAAHRTPLDEQYWKIMFVELGFGENGAPIGMQGVFPGNVAQVNVPRPINGSYMDQQQQQQHLHMQQQQVLHRQQQMAPPPVHQHSMHPQSPMHYQAMHQPTTPTYGH
ncbi:hypothetical protein D9619_005705 [Psilocybe cf. subviscida]|uniref:Zn(2)-C6 fungal-type domain-containing protein n=1 Tax=Psilocybe cf. subviscida TaxID=2480587 RepID=A0A8H5BXY9_9AGAR|nr:hypothetical protein D9619_005705 [Psilocybe cf. subviscida]